jgi:hypothetical protein
LCSCVAQRGALVDRALSLCAEHNSAIAEPRTCRRAGHTGEAKTNEFCVVFGLPPIGTTRWIRPSPCLRRLALAPSSTSTATRTCEGEKAGSPSARGMLPSRWVRHPLRSTPESSGCIYPLFLVLDACYGYIGQQGSKIRRWPNLLIFSLIFDEFDQTLIEPCGRILPDFEISDMPRCSLLHI